MNRPVAKTLRSRSVFSHKAYPFRRVSSPRWTDDAGRLRSIFVTAVRPELTYFHRESEAKSRKRFCDLHRFVLILALDHLKSAEHFLRFSEGAIGEEGSSFFLANRGGARHRMKSHGCTRVTTFY